MKQAMPPGPTGARPLRAFALGAGLRRAAFLAALLALPALSGCASGTAEQSWWNPMGLGPAPTSPPPATNVVVPARPADPLAAFAARAQAGQTETVSVPGSGRVVAARMVRSYNAASGRECRELQFGPSGVAGGAPGATYCNDPTQGWVAARALLRGGAVYRP
ncbi:common-antigen outer membrane protein [Roseomonas rosea]|uniref:Common-antigen outer membrane protein n=1 Tax=Muricoccus roseus TaxID=198092 RepID=A0A1M6G664_9PROT|nr:DVU3141 family protein [Roseomonas rosea]SHJ05287.1 common-antigen outer membrane protein [Roseomonas rosea]